MKLRIGIPFPIRVRSVDVDGKEFVIEAVLDNLSTGGLYLRLPRRLACDAEVSAVITLSPSQDPTSQGARVAIHGTVLRSEPQPDGTCGVAVGFQSYRFV